MKNLLFYLLCIVMCGKSTFFEQIQSQTNTEESKSKYNIKMVSSNQIRADLSDQMQMKNL